MAGRLASGIWQIKRPPREGSAGAKTNRMRGVGGWAREADRESSAAKRRIASDQVPSRPVGRQRLQTRYPKHLPGLLTFLSRMYG